MGSNTQLRRFRLDPCNQRAQECRQQHIGQRKRELSCSKRQQTWCWLELQMCLQLCERKQKLLRSVGL